MRSPLRAPLLALLAAAAAAPASARAEESASGSTTTLFGRPVQPRAPMDAAAIAARRASFRQHLAERGLTIAGDRVIPIDGFASAGQVPGLEAWDEPAHRATIFLNFFGGPMSYGTNAALMQSACIDGEYDYPGFAGGTTKAMAIIQVFQTKLAPYGVRVAYEEAPPPELPYSMVMMGGAPEDVGMDPGTLGVSCSSDCGDLWWRDTTLAFTENVYSANTIAYTALQEAAHAFGLDHIAGTSHIMYPYDTGGGDKIWADGCTNYDDATGPIGCTYVHEVFCPEGQQDDVAELLAFFGPDSPDSVAPSVEIVAPVDGLETAAPGTFTVEATVDDDYEGFGWKLVIEKDGEVLQEIPAFKSETSWKLQGLPAGAYAIRVEAVDHDRNVGTDEVLVYVGVPSGSGTDGTGTDAGTGGSEGTGAGTSGTSGTGASGDAATATGGEMGDDGCSCDAAAGQTLAPLLVGFLAAFGRRRRGRSR